MKIHDLASSGDCDGVRRELSKGAPVNARDEQDYNVIRLLATAGEDITDASPQMKRTLTGLREGETLNLSSSEYRSGKTRRFGRSNPEVMNVPFWREMVRAGISAYQARAQFGDTCDIQQPVWCFNRFGASFMELPDGGFVQIGGEHEDFYDPDFCIYNDVVVHKPPSPFQILGYPKEVFPPTDFHSATYVDGFIYVIGGLGYHGARRFGTTPIYRLNWMTWKMEAIQSAGENPGWTYRHQARLAEPGVLSVSGGKICVEIDGSEQHVENKEKFFLDLVTLAWSRRA